MIAGGGSGTDERFFHELKQGRPEGVKFVGFLTGEEFFSLYAHAKVFVFPSEYEAMSMALLEGMSFGVPTIYSNIPENEAVAKDLGYPFEVSNASSLSVQLDYVLSHYENAVKRGEKAVSVLKKKHDWEIIAKQYSDIYSDLGRSG